MNYGMYLSAAGVLTGSHRLDVAANNLANVNTPGFKPDFADLMQRLPATLEDNLSRLGSDKLLENLGGGTLVAPTRTSFAPAAPETTGNPLDVALLDEGFFVLDSGVGAGDERLRLSRDGRFTISHEGLLVSVTGGLPVLDTAGRTIRLDPSRAAAISNGGAITQDGATVAQLRVAQPIDETALRKAGQNTFRLDANRAGQLRTIEAAMQPGAFEGSGVDPIKAIMAVTKASGAVSAGTRLIRMHDEIMGQAINTFARIG